MFCEIWIKSNLEEVMSCEGLRFPTYAVDCWHLVIMIVFMNKIRLCCTRDTPKNAQSLPTDAEGRGCWICYMGVCSQVYTSHHPIIFPRQIKSAKCDVTDDVVGLASSLFHQVAELGKH